MLTIAALFTITFVFLYLHFTRKFDYWKSKNVPFLKPLPFFGNIINGILMRQCLGETFADLYFKTTKPFLGLFILDEPCLLVRDPELIKRILVTDFQYFNDRTGVNNEKDDPIGTYVLFMLKNPLWREIRTKISPVFTSSKIKNMSKLVEESCEEMVDYLGKLVAKNPVIETKEVCCKFTVDVISSTSFGVNSNCFKDENSQFRKAARKIFDFDDFSRSFQMRCFFVAPKLVPLFKMKLVSPFSAKFLKTNFLEIMEHRNVSKTIRNDLIDILLELKKNNDKFLEGDQLVSQAIMFFAAGFETSSSTMAFALYEIAINPEIQTRLRNEIEEISTKHDGINYESLKKMNYLEMCVKETMRKYPILPFLDRRSNDNYNIPGTDVVLDKNTAIFISTLALHYDPEYFPDPEKFDPERFSESNGQTRNFTFLPFGEGPRGCIGERFGMLNTKAGIASVLKHFKINPCKETPKQIKFKPNGFLLSPTSGITLNFSKI